MAKVPDIDKLDLKELKALRRDVDRAIAKYETRKRKEALAAAEAKAKQMGYSLNELMAMKQPGKPRAASRARATRDGSSCRYSGR